MARRYYEQPLYCTLHHVGGILNASCNQIQFVLMQTCTRSLHRRSPTRHFRCLYVSKAMTRIFACGSLAFLFFLPSPIVLLCRSFSRSQSTFFSSPVLFLLKHFSMIARKLNTEHLRSIFLYFFFVLHLTTALGLEICSLYIVVLHTGLCDTTAI